MAVIKSGASTDEWSIDATSKAGRITRYDSGGIELDKPSNLVQTGTAASGAALTITLPVVTGKAHYITSIQIVKFAAALLTAAAAPVVITTTNLNSLAFSFSAGADAQGTSEIQVITPTTPIKALEAGVATTIVCPATANIIWRVNVTYFTA